METYADALRQDRSNSGRTARLLLLAPTVMCSCCGRRLLLHPVATTDNADPLRQRSVRVKRVRDPLPFPLVSGL
jgi:hypothetical protein